MKKALALFGLVLGGSSLHAQVSTIPAENIVPDDTLVIMVDISALDQGLEHNVLLKDAVDAGEDMYIWTWAPVEHPVGHPYVNGEGSQPWKNSNDTLRMKHEGGYVFSFTMVPTIWYGTSAANVYALDIEFLVKPKDGGGYGDPDIKSSDLKVAVDPPTTTKDPLYEFPSYFSAEDVITVMYDNNRETKSTMQDLTMGNVFVYLEYWVEGQDVNGPGTAYVSWGQTPSTPELVMDEGEPGIFQWSFVPNDFLNQNGTNDTIIQVKAIVRRGDVGTAAGRNAKDLFLDMEECP